MKKKKSKTPVGLLDYPSMLEVIEALKSSDVVIVSDAIMQRYFGMTWKQYQKIKNKKDDSFNG